MKFALVLFVVIFHQGMDAEGIAAVKPNEKRFTANKELISKFKKNGGVETELPKAEDVHLSEDDPATSAYDMAWQALHMAAAAACRGSTPTGGSGTHVNAVLNRDSRGPKSCNQLCSETVFTHCDAEVSIHGKVGKATENGQDVGSFYNYGCDRGYRGYGRSEASSNDEEILESKGGAFSFCCCRK
ncbi:uncharacterized protein LOC144655577 isoform X1 [Oculina patagonica]